MSPANHSPSARGQRAPRNLTRGSSVLYSDDSDYDVENVASPSTGKTARGGRPIRRAAARRVDSGSEDYNNNSNSNSNSNEDVSMEIDSDDDDFSPATPAQRGSRGSRAQRNAGGNTGGQNGHVKRSSATPLSAAGNRARGSKQQRGSDANDSPFSVPSGGNTPYSQGRNQGMKRRESMGSISRLSTYSTPTRDGSPLQLYSAGRRPNSAGNTSFNDKLRGAGTPGSAGGDASVLVNSASSSVKRLRRTSDMFERAGSPLLGRRQSLEFQSPAAKYSLSDTRNDRFRGRNLGQAGQPKLNLNSEELRNSFDAWMKIVADNKINANNSWNLALIDYFHDMTLNRSGEQINFQVASCTLDGCVKIYTSRIDSVDIETKKLLSGLVNSADDDSGRIENDEDDDGDEETSKKKSKARGNRSTQTLEKDISNLDFKKLDLEFMVDPLFKKTSVDFDEGGARGLLLNHLNIDARGRIIFDSSDNAEDQIVPIDDNEAEEEDGGDDDDSIQEIITTKNGETKVKPAQLSKNLPELKSEPVNATKLISKFSNLFQLLPAVAKKEHIVKSETSQESVTYEKMRTILSRTNLCAPLRKFEFNSTTLDMGDSEETKNEGGSGSGAIEEDMFDDIDKLNLTQTPNTAMNSPQKKTNAPRSASNMNEETTQNDYNDDGYDFFGMDDGPMGDDYENFNGPIDSGNGMIDNRDMASGLDNFANLPDNMEDDEAIDYIFGDGKNKKGMNNPNEEDILEMLGTGFKENNTMFSYFNDKFQWAGPAFWKSRRNKLNREKVTDDDDQLQSEKPVDDEEAQQKKKLKKLQNVPNFSGPPVDFAEFERIAPHAPTQLPEARLYNMNDANLLGERKTFSAKDILSLFLKPGKPLRFVRKDGTYAEVDVNQEINEEFMEDFNGELDPEDQNANIVDNGAAPEQGDYDDEDDDQGFFEGFGYDDDDAYYAQPRLPTIGMGISENMAGAGVDATAPVTEEETTPIEGVDASEPSADAEVAADGDQEAAEQPEPAVDYGSQFVAKPKTTATIPLSFSRVAKRVDIKRLKKNIWKDLLGELLDRENLSKINERQQEEEQARDEELPEDELIIAPSQTGEKEGQMPSGERKNFTEVVSDIDAVYPERARQDISVAFCFICVLHLANDHGLRVVANEEMNDLTITQG